LTICRKRYREFRKRRGGRRVTAVALAGIQLGTNDEEGGEKLLLSVLVVVFGCEGGGGKLVSVSAPGKRKKE